MSQLKRLRLSHVTSAASLIKNLVVQTPVKTSPSINKLVSASLFNSSSRDIKSLPKIKVFFKCENLQRSGSFKFRGAAHFLTRLSNDELKRGVVAYSTGNHALAVAMAANHISQQRNISIPIDVVVPIDSPPAKVKAAEQYGAVVTFAGVNPEDRSSLAEFIRKEKNATLVPPSDHRDIALGQGTAMTEFITQMTHLGGLDAVIMPSAGGGLLAGASIVCYGTNIKVFGSEPLKGGAQLAVGIAQQRRVTTLTSTTIADGLRSIVGESNWELLRCKTYVDNVFSVTEDDIKSAMRTIIEHTKLLVETSAAVPLAAVLFNRKLHQQLLRENSEWNIGVILSGGNTSIDGIVSLFGGSLDRDGFLTLEPQEHGVLESRSVSDT